MVSTPKKKILVVDDEPLIRDLIKDAISDLGEITCCENGAVAIDRLNHEVFDLVISDIAMPVMSGLELLYIIKEIGITVPVIILTGFNDKGKTKEAWDKGAFDLIEKPIDFSKLQLIVRKGLQMGRQIESLPEAEPKKRTNPVTIYFNEDEFKAIDDNCSKNSLAINLYLYKIIKEQLNL